VGKISRIRLTADGKKKTEDRGVEEQELAVLLTPRPLPAAGGKETCKAAGKRTRSAGRKG